MVFVCSGSSLFLFSLSVSLCLSLSLSVSIFLDVGGVSCSLSLSLLTGVIYCAPPPPPPPPSHLSVFFSLGVVCVSTKNSPVIVIDNIISLFSATSGFGSAIHVEYVDFVPGDFRVSFYIDDEYKTPKCLSTMHATTTTTTTTNTHTHMQ